MAATFKLKVVTPDELFYEGDVVSVVAPGALGYLGILKDHAPFVTSVTKGMLTFRDESGKSETFEVEGGFLEVSSNNVLVLTNRVESVPVSARP